MKTIRITPSILRAVKRGISAALEYEKKLTGRKLGITGEIGEVLTCHDQKLKKFKLELLENPLSAGYDAVDKNKKSYQIKTIRKVNWKRRRVGEVGTFSKHKFDYALLSLLNEGYEIKEIYRAGFKKLSPILRRKNYRISIQKFISVSDLKIKK